MMKSMFKGIIALNVLALICSAHAEFSATNHPFAGITYYSETRTNPPTHLFVAEIDLANPKVHLHVSPAGPDPDGAGSWQTTLMPPTEIAEREKYDFVINGDFFKALATKDIEGTNSGYRAGKWAAVVGPAVTDGKIWSTNATARPCLVVHKNGKVMIKRISTPADNDFEVISGNTILVKNGVSVADHSKTRHPRTVVGLDATGKKLIILLVDGRKPGVAVGMSYEELATEMIRLGCKDALNLDGGGSSVMAVRDAATDKFHILNEPTDGRERAVANVLGISVGK